MQCLRCDATLTDAEIEHGGRWREFCGECREALHKQWPTNRPQLSGCCPTCGHDSDCSCHDYHEDF